MSREFLVARIQEIINKIQFFCKLYFKNAIDVAVVLEVKGFETAELQSLIGAGVKILAFESEPLVWELNQVLPNVKKYFVGKLLERDLENILDAGFDLIETVDNYEIAERISILNARKGRVTNILLKVNALNEDESHGFPLKTAMGSLEKIGKLSGIRIQGYSTYLGNESESKILKSVLRKLKVLLVMSSQKFRGIEVLSFNYLPKIELLVEEGMTELRLRAIDFEK